MSVLSACRKALACKFWASSVPRTSRYGHFT